VHHLVGIGLVSVNDAVVDDLGNGDHDAVEHRLLEQQFIVEFKDELLNESNIRTNARYADGFCQYRIAQMACLLLCAGNSGM
jgi:hypothetical protein